MNLLKRIFGENNKDNFDNQDQEFERLLEENKQDKGNIMAASHINNNKSYNAFPGLNIEKHYKKISINLSDDGMNESITRNGNLEHLGVLLTNVRSNYMEELVILKESVRNEATNENHKCDQEIINKRNKLRHIKENLIPETRMEVEEAKAEIAQLQERSTDEFEDLNSGFNTSLISETRKSILTFKKNIRELLSKSISLESDVDQLENKKAQLLANIEIFNPFSSETLENKLTTFFQGWLRGLEMIDADPAYLDQANAIFSKFLMELDANNKYSNKDYALRKIA